MEPYVDYKEMYLTLIRATEAAINLLVEAQQKCEALYLDAKEPRLVEFHKGGDDAKD